MIYVYFKTVCFKYTTFGHLKSILEEYIPTSILHMYFPYKYTWSILEIHFKYTSGIFVYQVTYWIAQLPWHEKLFLPTERV